MSRRKKRRRRSGEEKDEKVVSGKTNAESRRGPVKDREQLLHLDAGNRTPQSVQEATLRDMQQQVGNSTVQQVLGGAIVQRQTDEEAAGEQAEEELVEPESYEFRAEADLREGGELELRLQPALDLSRYGLDKESDLRHQVKQWLGVGAVGVDEVAQSVKDLRMATDGRLTIQLDPGFLDHVAALAETGAAEAEGMGELQREQLVGRLAADVTATLHTRADDPELEGLDLEHKNRLLSGQGDRGLFLLFNWETVNFSDINEAFMEEMEGMLLFAAEV
jgi:hypothetical protein